MVLVHNHYIYIDIYMYNCTYTIYYNIYIRCIYVFISLRTCLKEGHISMVETSDSDQWICAERQLETEITQKYQNYKLFSQVHFFGVGGRWSENEDLASVFLSFCKYGDRCLTGDQWMCTRGNNQKQFSNLSNFRLFLSRQHIFPETRLTEISDQCENCFQLKL